MRNVATTVFLLSPSASPRAFPCPQHSIPQVCSVYQLLINKKGATLLFGHSLLPLQAHSPHAHPPPPPLRVLTLPLVNRLPAQAGPSCGCGAIAGALRARPCRECNRVSLFARGFS